MYYLNPFSNCLIIYINFYVMTKRDKGQRELVEPNYLGSIHHTLDSTKRAKVIMGLQRSLKVSTKEQ